MSETVVITGGHGFVGRHLQQELQSAWPSVQVVVWDMPDVDITKPETYRETLTQLKPAWIVHLAALAAVGQSFDNQDRVFQVNVEGTRTLLQAMRESSPATQCLAVSSSDIYGQASPTPLTELSLAQAQPKSPYAKSKWEMEKLIEDSFTDRVIRVRPFPHIGPGQGLGFVSADFASQLAAIEKGKQPPVVSVGNLEAQRDFTDVRDVVRAYRLLLQHGRVGEVYHVASGQPISIKTVLDQLISLTHVPVTITVDPGKQRPSDIPILVGDATKLRALTDWQPTIALPQTLADILNWWRAQ